MSPYQCEWAGCNRTSSSDKALFEHLLAEHAQPKNVVGGVLECEWARCSTRPQWNSGRNVMVVDHLRKHTPYEEFSCSRCGETMKYSQSLKYHTAKSCGASKPSGSGTRASDDEDEVDSNNSERSTAKARPLSPAGSESSTGTPQLCLWPECSSEFSLADPATLGEHICDHFVDGGGEECQWDDCGDEFADAGLYRQHVKDAHLPEWETPFQCPHCPRQFKKKAGIVVHIKRLHPSNDSAAKTASPNKSPSKKRTLSSDEEEEEEHTSERLRPRRSAAIAKKKKTKGSPAKATGAKAKKQKNETPDIWAQMRDVIEDKVNELIQETVARKLGLAKLYCSRSPSRASGARVPREIKNETIEVVRYQEHS